MIRPEQNTHGVDGALLGTEWCGASGNKGQCQLVIPTGRGWLCCALVEGHADGHRDHSTAAQEPQSKWVHRSKVQHG